ncbi:MAG: DEAD/DEAH box helicase [Alphaproteobacteria bacterium]
MTNSKDFAALGLMPPLLSALKAQNITTPTDIQAMAIPPILAGRDFVGRAQTGSGKSLAFILPLLQQCLNGHMRSLILAPTRELADQLHQVIRTFSSQISDKKIRTSLIVGGHSMHVQESSLAKKPHFIVATAGRLLDHMKSGSFNAATITHFVLDEADRLLDMGFLEDIQHISNAASAREQTLMFSATFNETLRKFARSLLNNPVNITLTDYTNSHDDIEESLIICDDYAHKKDILLHILNQKELKQAIIFTATRTAVDELEYFLHDAGYDVSAIHGKMGQTARFKAVERLTDNLSLALIATDVAARGLDIRQVSHVINFDIPLTPDDYIHRIGRTGRAGDKGYAISLAGRGDQHKLNAIEELIQRKIKRVNIKGLESKTDKNLAQQKNKRDKQDKQNKFKKQKIKNAVENALRPQGWAKPKAKAGLKARKNKSKK